MSAASTAEPAFVAKTKTGRITDFVDSRVGGSGILREFGRKVFPDHWSFMFGEVALYSFVILLLSGTFLTFFFDPSMAETHYDGGYVPLKGVEMSVAYSSSLNISFDVRGGLFMRQVHHWAALLFVASVAVHMLRVFFTGAFRRPREMNWVVGCVLLILAMAAGFTGYSLPDDLRKGEVELGCLFSPHFTARRAEREVHGEKTGEEHQLAGQPHNGSDRNHVGAVQRWVRRGTGGMGRRCHIDIMSVKVRAAQRKPPFGRTFSTKTRNCPEKFPAPFTLVSACHRSIASAGDFTGICSVRQHLAPADLGTDQGQ